MAHAYRLVHLCTCPASALAQDRHQRAGKNYAEKGGTMQLSEVPHLKFLFVLFLKIELAATLWLGRKLKL